jgi:hypothetical protein
MGEKINWSLVGQEMAVTEKLFTKKKKKKRYIKTIFNVPQKYQSCWCRQKRCNVTLGTTREVFQMQYMEWYGSAGERKKETTHCCQFHPNPCQLYHVALSFGGPPQ